MKLNILLCLILFVGCALTGCKSSDKPQKVTTEETVEKDPPVKPTEEAGRPSACTAISTRGKFPNDMIDLQKAEIKGDCLYLYVGYSGGCKEHSFQLYWSGIVAKSLPPQAPLHLMHDSAEDYCEQYITEVLKYDLSSLKTTAIDQVIINLKAGKHEKTTRITYSFTK